MHTQNEVYPIWRTHLVTLNLLINCEKWLTIRKHIVTVDLAIFLNMIESIKPRKGGLNNGPSQISNTYRFVRIRASSLWRRRI